MAHRQTQYSETMEIPQTSRGFFLRNRDAMKETCHVDLFFPRDQRSGDYQTMVIKGGPMAISKARIQLNRILAEANAEYADYKARQERRKHWERKMASEHKAPTQPSALAKSKQKPVVKNPFAVLFVDDEDKPKAKQTRKVSVKPTEEFPSLNAEEVSRKEKRQAERRERIAKRKTATESEAPKMDYAAAASKDTEVHVPAIVPEEREVKRKATEDIPKRLPKRLKLETATVSKPDLSKMSWGDIVDMEDSDSEDED